MCPIEKDPVSLLITGVGGQGNILISRLIGQAMVDQGWQVTIGETYGASQRGGSVASHVRFSRRRAYGPIMPVGDADILLGLEPVESLRLLCFYGRPETCVITNTRPIHPMAVSTGESEYPSLGTIKGFIGELSRKAWYIDASEVAMGLGNALLTNIVMTGALTASGLLPIDYERMSALIRKSFHGEKGNLNLEAFERGFSMIELT